MLRIRRPYRNTSFHSVKRSKSSRITRSKKWSCILVGMETRKKFPQCPTVLHVKENANQTAPLLLPPLSLFLVLEISENRHLVFVLQHLHSLESIMGWPCLPKDPMGICMFLPSGSALSSITSTMKGWTS